MARGSSNSVLVRFYLLGQTLVKKPSCQTWVAYYDLHYPKWDVPTFRALEHFLRENKVAGFIFGGDQLDLESISHHTKGKPLYRPPKSYLRDIEGFEKDILGPIEKLLPPTATKIWHIGNHERFEFDLVEEHPELDGLVDHTRHFKLEQRGWKIIPLGHSNKIGKLTTCHGEILTGIGNQAGAFPAKKAVELYGTSVLAGHTHSPQSFCKISPVEHIQKWMAWIAPIGGKTNPGYLRNRATAWLNGLVIIELQADGLFNLYPCIVSKGRFAYGGKIYGA
jgi:hypothetical protein